MKHEPITTGNALGAVVGITYIVCAIGVALAPDLALYLARSWFHGIEIQASTFNRTPDMVIIGFLSAVAGAWILGYLFATIYNSLLKKN